MVVKVTRVQAADETLKCLPRAHAEAGLSVTDRERAQRSPQPGRWVWNSQCREPLSVQGSVRPGGRARRAHDEFGRESSGRGHQGRGLPEGVSGGRARSVREAASPRSTRGSSGQRARAAGMCHLRWQHSRDWPRPEGSVGRAPQAVARPCSAGPRAALRPEQPSVGTAPHLWWHGQRAPKGLLTAAHAARSASAEGAADCGARRTDSRAASEANGQGPLLCRRLPAVHHHREGEDISGRATRCCQCRSPGRRLHVVLWRRIGPVVDDRQKQSPRPSGYRPLWLIHEALLTLAGPVSADVIPTGSSLSGMRSVGCTLSPFARRDNRAYRRVTSCAVAHAAQPPQRGAPPC